MPARKTLLLSYVMEAVLDTGFSVLHKLLPLFASTKLKSPHQYFAYYASAEIPCIFDRLRSSWKLFIVNFQKAMR